MFLGRERGWEEIDVNNYFIIRNERNIINVCFWVEKGWEEIGWIAYGESYGDIEGNPVNFC